MQLELNEQERQELLDLLHAAKAETQAEIHHAMDHQFRERLRARREVLDGLAKRLGGAAQ